MACGQGSYSYIQMCRVHGSSSLGNLSTTSLRRKARLALCWPFPHSWHLQDQFPGLRYRQMVCPHGGHGSAEGQLYRALDRPCCCPCTRSDVGQTREQVELPGLGVHQGQRAEQDLPLAWPALLQRDHPGDLLLHGERRGACRVSEVEGLIRGGRQAEVLLQSYG